MRVLKWLKSETSEAKYYFLTLSSVRDKCMLCYFLFWAPSMMIWSKYCVPSCWCWRVLPPPWSSLGHLSFISFWLHLLPGVIAQIIHFSRILTPKQKAESNTLTRSNPEGCFLWLWGVLSFWVYPLSCYCLSSLEGVRGEGQGIEKTW